MKKQELEWTERNMKLTSKQSSLGSNPNSALNCHPDAVPWMDINEGPAGQHSLGDVKDSTVSFVKTRRTILGTLAKLQIPALT